MATNDLIDDLADLGSEEEEGGSDEEMGEPKRQKQKDANGGLEDSSEEDDDDDEEAAAAIREGFIVDEDEEEEDAARAVRRRERKKRRRAEREEEEEALDEEDLDLIGEANPEFERREKDKRIFKRLKRGHKEDRTRTEPRGVEEIFSDEEDELVDDDRGPPRRGMVDEFEDFIEEDEFDDEERNQLMEDREVARPARKGLADLGVDQAAGLDESALEDMRAAFGDGTEYDWALQLQYEADEQDEGMERPLELKDVFEPAQLIDRFLTEEDEIIRKTDVPERYQIARKPFTQPELTQEEIDARLQEEASWVANMMLPRKGWGRHFVPAFQKACRKVLEFMNLEDLEVPFIYQHRRDYLIHSVDPGSPDSDNAADTGPQRLLLQSDMWEIQELDLKFRAMLDKRDALQRHYDNLRSFNESIDDQVFKDTLKNAMTIEEVQDVQDYIYFQYSAELRDVNLTIAETNGTQKRAMSSRSVYEKIRASKVYNVVRAFGITADNLAQSFFVSRHLQYTEDPSDRPDDLADAHIDYPEYPSGAQVLRAARTMYCEELVNSPRMRKLIRQNLYQRGRFDVFRTTKGLRKITEDSPYYEFKYLRNQELTTLAKRPELYLRMLKAESDGLVDVQVRMDGFDRFKEDLYKYIESDNFSEVADAWNALRREVLDQALEKLMKLLTRNVKETLKSECESEIARACRAKYLKKLDQAPWKSRAMDFGVPCRVLAMSNGKGVPNRDATVWVYVDEEGRMLENGKFVDLKIGNPDKYIPDGKDVRAFVELVSRRRPDVIAIGGFSVETRKLYKDVHDLIDKYDVRGPDWEDDDGNERSDKVEVILVNDETARLYHGTERAAQELPSLVPMGRYCVGLARYVQSPLKCYAALGKDITSISFDPNQELVSREKLMRYLDTAMIDIVNLVGVDVNEAIHDPAEAQLLPYVCGLGPRKAAQLLKVANLNGGQINSRAELVGDPDNNIYPAVSAKVWDNCCSFLIIEFDPTDPESEYLDNTRVHPEDYDLAKKMAADALELDEEDVQAEVDENGPAAVIRKLVRDEMQDKLNDLALEEYAEQLEIKFKQHKRATLYTIREELAAPFEELRHSFSLISTEELFTMLTAETKDSLVDGMVVPVSIRRIFPDHIEVRLDCGVEGGVSEVEFPSGVGGNGIDPRAAYQPGQVLQAKLTYLNRKQFTAQLSMREEQVRRPARKTFDHMPGEWDEKQEAQDRKEQVRKDEMLFGRTQRVIKHPLFHTFNSAQAEEYLGSQGRGDVVVRPSSKGPNHLAVTWKVSDGVYQHIDVLELDKENEFSVGRVLKISGKYTYSDLDDLVVNHIKAMAKKVDEMMNDEKYQNGTKAQTEQWLTTYTEANPKRSMYAFCIYPKYPGYFHLCFKAGQQAQLCSWPVKVVPNAFELMRNQYPDMRALKNGFKVLFGKQTAQRR